MPRKLYVLLSALFAAAIFVPAPALAQSTPALLKAPEAAKILPSAVFFRGQSAPVQARNSGGVKYADGFLVLATLVDNSGYSSSIQQKYQSYFITEVSLEVGGHLLQPGAYGIGFVGGRFGVMDLGAHDLFSIDATKDAKITRPTPLQVLADTAPEHYRLYQGREYVVFNRAAGK